MSCAINIPCFNPFANTFAETCYTNISVVNNTYSNTRPRVEGGDVTIDAGVIEITSSSNNFEDITKIQINNSYTINGSTSFDLVFKPNLIIGSIIRIYQATTLGSPVTPTVDYGIYLITNLTVIGVTLECELTFISGDGSYTNSSLGNPSYIGCNLSEGYFGSVFQLNDPEEEEVYCDNSFKECDYISSIITELECVAFSYPDSGVVIKNLIYWDSDTNSYTTTVTNFFVGFTLINGNGEDITYSSDCLISICLNQKQEINDEVLCFKLKLLYLQCEYSKKVDVLINKQKFGQNVECELKELNTFRRLLILLNKYDVRDIAGETTLYNNLSYSEIKILINKLEIC